jgi:hypothetical protein
MVEAFMAAPKGMLCQIIQTQQQLVQMLQQQPPLGACHTRFSEEKPSATYMYARI